MISNQPFSTRFVSRVAPLVTKTKDMGCHWKGIRWWSKHICHHPCPKAGDWVRPNGDFDSPKWLRRSLLPTKRGKPKNEESCPTLPLEMLGFVAVCLAPILAEPEAYGENLHRGHWISAEGFATSDTYAT